VAKNVGADKKRGGDTFAKALGAELTDLRLSKGWSQQTLADRVGYDESYVRQTEMGRNPTLELLIAFASIFSVKLSDLIRRAENRLSENPDARDTRSTNT
jgi:transcriptional regulator with XRE-family HTH domain